MKAWHVLVVAVIGVVAFYGWKHLRKSQQSAARPAKTTIPQTPIQQRGPAKAVSVVRKPISAASKLSGAARSAATVAISNSGIPGAKILAKPGGAIAAKGVSLVRKLF